MHAHNETNAYCRVGKKGSLALLQLDSAQVEVPQRISVELEFLDTPATLVFP